MATSTIFLLITTSWAGNPKANYEWSMKYSEIVDVHQKMCQFIAAKYPAATVLTVFPHIKQLIFPHIGYVSEPIKAVRYKPDKPLDDDFDLVLISTQSDIHENSGLAALVEELVLIKQFGGDQVNSVLYAKLDAVASQQQ